MLQITDEILYTSRQLFQLETTSILPHIYHVIHRMRARVYPLQFTTEHHSCLWPSPIMFLHYLLSFSFYFNPSPLLFSASSFINVYLTFSLFPISKKKKSTGFGDMKWNFSYGYLVISLLFSFIASLFLSYISIPTRPLLSYSHSCPPFPFSFICSLPSFLDWPLLP